MAKPKKAAKRKPGKPSKRTPEALEAIGLRLGKGEPLTHICKDLRLGVQTVRDWMEDPAVSVLIARAREEGEQAIAHRLRETARGQGDSSGDVQRDKLIIDTDLKLLAKFNPKRWGDKVQLADADGNKIPAPIAWVVAPVAAKE